MITESKPAKRLFSWILVLFLVLGWTPAVPVFAETAATAEEAEPTEPETLTLAELMRKFPDGKYWNGGDPDGWTETPCTHHGNCGSKGYNGWCGCNSFNGQSIQCMGFAEKLGYDATGYNPRVNENGWYTYSSSSALNNLKAGDIVRRNGHSMYVTAVDGDTVTIADCNALNRSCNIRWGVTVTKSNLRSSFEYVRSAPTELVIGYLGKCEEYPSSGTFCVMYDTVLKTDPCTSDIYEGSLDVAHVSAGTELTVTGVCKNTEGQYWYQVSWEEQSIYVSADAAGEFAPDFGTVTVSGVSAPVNTKKGSGFPIKGTVESDKLPLSQVGAYIFEGSSVSDTPYMTSEDTVSNKFTYSIRSSAVDNNLTFGKLPLGSYTYLLTAAVTNYYVGETGIVSDQRITRLHQNTFAVSSSSYSHSFTEEVTAEATCGEDGEITYTCKNCAFTYTQTIFATGEHTLGQWETVQAPTCTEEGYAVRGCTGCTLAYVKILPAGNHPNESLVYTPPTCTEMGYTTIICADCGETLYFEDYEAALGHQYGEPVILTPATMNTPGEQQQVCTRCGDVRCQEIPVLAGEVEEWGLTLDGELLVGFRMRLQEDASMVVTVADKVYPCDAVSIYNAEGDVYQFSVPVAASQMTDDIQVQILNGEQVSVVESYSVAEYAIQMLEDETQSGSHQLIREMLSYGAAAQAYFDYHRESAVNADLTGTAAQEVPDTWKQPVEITGSAEGIRFYGATLVFRDVIAVRYYFTLSAEADSFTFKSGGREFAPVQSGNLWYVELPGILIQDLDDTLSLTVNDSMTVTYCPMHYIVRMNQKGDETTKALMKAMYNYHLAAEEYIKAE